MKQEQPEKVYNYEDCLDFYYENNIKINEFIYLEKNGCDAFGKTLEEIKNLGIDFLRKKIHPEDLERCTNLIMKFATKKMKIKRFHITIGLKQITNT